MNYENLIAMKDQSMDDLMSKAKLIDKVLLSELEFPIEDILDT